MLQKRVHDSLCGSGEVVGCSGYSDIHISSSTTPNEGANTCGGQLPDPYWFDVGLVLLPFTALRITLLGSHPSNRHPEHRVIIRALASSRRISKGPPAIELGADLIALHRLQLFLWLKREVWVW